MKAKQVNEFLNEGRYNNLDSRHEYNINDLIREVSWYIDEKLPEVGIDYIRGWLNKIDIIDLGFYQDTFTKEDVDRQRKNYLRLFKKKLRDDEKRW